MAIAEVLTWIAKNWKTILALMGLALAGVTAFTVSQSIMQAQPQIAQAIAIASYAIPIVVYSLVLQFVFQLISQIREMFK